MEFVKVIPSITQNDGGVAAEARVNKIASIIGKIYRDRSGQHGVEVVSKVDLREGLTLAVIGDGKLQRGGSTGSDRVFEEIFGKRNVGEVLGRDHFENGTSAPGRYGLRVLEA